MFALQPGISASFVHHTQTCRVCDLSLFLFCTEGAGFGILMR